MRLSYHQQYIMADLESGCRIDCIIPHVNRRTTYMVVGGAGDMNRNVGIINYGISPATFEALKRKGLIEERAQSGRFYLASDAAAGLD